jgi:hypothetical protein
MEQRLCGQNPYFIESVFAPKLIAYRLTFPVFGLPAVVGVVLDTVLAAQVPHLDPGLGPLQDPNDLFLGKPAAFHLDSS